MICKYCGYKGVTNYATISPSPKGDYMTREFYKCNSCSRLFAADVYPPPMPSQERNWFYLPDDKALFYQEQIERESYEA